MVGGGVSGCGEILQKNKECEIHIFTVHKGGYFQEKLAMHETRESH